MGSTRDWRESYSELELARGRERGRRAVSEAVGGILSLAEPVSEMELILPAAKPKPSAEPKAAKKPAKRKTAAKARKPVRKPAPRKKAEGKPAARMPAARKAKPKAAAPPRDTAAARLAEALAAKLAESPAIPLPDVPAPLVEPALPPQAVAPLPRKASLTHYRKGGLIEAIGFWLRTTARRAKAKLGASKVLAEAVEHKSGEHEIEELKAENERLRRQLDALLTLSDAAQFKFQS